MNFRLTKRAGTHLPLEAHPAKNLMLKASSIDEGKFRALDHVLRSQSKADPLLEEILIGLGSKIDGEISVVATSGVPAPYDAWTSKMDDQIRIFFNLDQWDHDQIKNKASRVIWHEVTHFVLAPFFDSHFDSTFATRLERIVIDEGIAHFVGFPGDRSKLLDDWRDRWPKAEEDLNEALVQLKDPDKNQQLKENLSAKAETGPFWDKFGAIAGMFRAAQVYNNHGAQGLVAAIQNRHLSPKDLEE